MAALLLPSALLLCALGGGALLLAIVRAACLRGMGQRPMLDVSRATYPMARGSACQARGSVVSRGLSSSSGVSLRVVRHGLDPRGAAPAKAWPFSSLIDRPAAGGTVARCAHGGAGYSGETCNVLEELPVSPPGPISCVPFPSLPSV